MDSLRVLHEPPVPAEWGLAVDEHLFEAAQAGEIGPALHLYSFEPVVICGRFQDVYAEVDLEACRRLKVAVNRRTTGGGAILMTPDQLAVACIVPCEASPAAAWQKFTELAEALAAAFSAQGWPTRFRPRNDLEIEGKKVAGLASTGGEQGVLLFHASVLVDLDLALMLEVLNIPLAKLQDHRLESASERLTTLRQVAGEALYLEDVAKVVEAALAGALGLVPEKGEFADWEKQKIARLQQARYANPDWIFSQRHPRRVMGTAEARLPVGTVRVAAARSGGVVDQVLFTGDFLLPAEFIVQLEAALKGVRATKEALLQRMKAFFTEYSGPKVPVEALTDLLLEAIEPNGG